MTAPKKRGHCRIGCAPSPRRGASLSVARLRFVLLQHAFDKFVDIANNAAATTLATNDRVELVVVELECLYLFMFTFVILFSFCLGPPFRPVCFD